MAQITDTGGSSGRKSPVPTKLRVPPKQTRSVTPAEQAKNTAVQSSKAKFAQSQRVARAEARPGAPDLARSSFSRTSNPDERGSGTAYPAVPYTRSSRSPVPTSAGQAVARAGANLVNAAAQRVSQALTPSSNSKTSRPKPYSVLDESIKAVAKVVGVKAPATPKPSVKPITSRPKTKRSTSGTPRYRASKPGTR